VPYNIPNGRKIDRKKHKTSSIATPSKKLPKMGFWVLKYDIWQLGQKPMFEIFTLMLNLRQGDQIGRIFANWAIVLFRHCFKITEVAQMFGQLFSQGKMLCIKMTQISLAAFWAIFS
jgi:hypothetical protein